MRSAACASAESPGYGAHAYASSARHAHAHAHAHAMSCFFFRSVVLLGFVLVYLPAYLPACTHTCTCVRVGIRSFSVHASRMRRHVRARLAAPHRASPPTRTRECECARATVGHKSSRFPHFSLSSFSAFRFVFLSPLLSSSLSSPLRFCSILSLPLLVVSSALLLSCSSSLCTSISSCSSSPSQAGVRDVDPAAAFTPLVWAMTRLPRDGAVMGSEEQFGQHHTTGVAKLNFFTGESYPKPVVIEDEGA